MKVKFQVESGVLLLASISSTVIAVTVPVAALPMFEVKELPGKGFSHYLVLRVDYKQSDTLANVE